MLTLDLRPRLEPTDGSARGELAELAELAASLGSRWPDLPAPIALEWTDRPVLALDRDVPWLYGPIERDPLMGPDGPAVLPRRQRRRLAAVAATGPAFPALGIAHELDAAGPVRSVLPLLREGPRICTDEAARELVGPVPAHPGVLRSARLLDSLIGGAALAAAAGALDVLLDPIVFGVVAPTRLVPGTPSLWYPLAAWRW